MTICIAGKNNIAVEILNYLICKYHYEVVVVCNKIDDGVNSWQKSLRYIAGLHKIPVKELKDVYQIPELLFLSLEFDQIIKPELFLSKRLYNIHFSLLPAYKGMYTSVMPLLFGEEKSGVTLHRIDAGIDTGELIDQVDFRITKTDVASDLYDKYIHFSTELVKKNLDNLIHNSETSKPQPIENASYFSKKTIDFSNIQIDLKKTAWEIHNQIRAYSFRCYQLPTIDGHKVYKSEILQVPSDKKNIGRIQKIEKHILWIDAIDYVIRVYIDFEAELFDCARVGDINRIEQIANLDYDIHVKNKLGWDLLIVAAYNENLELVRYLLSKEFSVTETNFKGTTVYMYAMTAASKSGRTDILEELLSHGADLKSKDDKGLNVLDYAKQYGNPKIINYIQLNYDKIS